MSPRVKTATIAILLPEPDDGLDTAEITIDVETVKITSQSLL